MVARVHNMKYFRRPRLYFVHSQPETCFDSVETNFESKFNDLPVVIRREESYAKFCTDIKNYYFDCAIARILTETR